MPELNNLNLSQLPVALRQMLAAFLVLLTTGVSVGLVHLYNTTSLTPGGTVSHYQGSQNGDDPSGFDIPVNYPRPVSELLITTHNHLIGFSFIFICLMFPFYFTNVIRGFWKRFFLVEPFLSVLITFGALWLVRFGYTGFVYISFIGAALTYTSYYLIAGILLFELHRK